MTDIKHKYITEFKQQFSMFAHIKAKRKLHEDHNGEAQIA